MQNRDPRNIGLLGTKEFHFKNKQKISLQRNNWFESDLNETNPAPTPTKVHCSKYSMFQFFGVEC